MLIAKTMGIGFKLPPDQPSHNSVWIFKKNLLDRPKNGFQKNHHKKFFGKKLKC